MITIARWLLYVYPRHWRQRYEAEVAALLEDHTVTIITILDLLLNAIDARLDPTFHRTGGLPRMDPRQPVRLASRAAFWAAFFFFASYYVAILDRLDGRWDAVRGTPSVAATAYSVSQMSAGVIVLTLVLTSLIVEIARTRAVRGTLNKLRHVVGGIGLPLISVAAGWVHALLLQGMPWDLWLFLVMFGGLLAIPLNLGLVMGNRDVGEFETRAAQVGAMVVGLAMTVSVLGLVVVQTITSAALPNGSWSTQMVEAFALLVVPLSVAVGALFILVGRGPRETSRTVARG